MTDPTPQNPPQNPPTNSTPPPQQNSSPDHEDRFQRIEGSISALGASITAMPETIARAVKEALPQHSSPTPPANSSQQQQSQGQNSDSSSPSNDGNNSGGNASGNGETQPGKAKRKGPTLFGMDLGF